MAARLQPPNDNDRDAAFDSFYDELPYPAHVEQREGEKDKAFMSRLTREWLHMVYNAGWRAHEEMADGEA